MFFSAKLLALVALASPAFSAAIERRTTGLDVKFEAIGNTEIKAVLTNTAGEDLKLYTAGTFLDKAPIRKANVYKDGKFSFPVG